MSNGIFGIGLSGLSAAQTGLATTSHNISNVNTPNYSRQEVLQSTRQPQFTGSGFLGSGVDVDTVRRIYSEFLTSQLRQTQAGASDADVRQTQLGALDNLFGDPTTGIAPALNDFFAGVNAVAAHPADIPSRQTLLSAGESLVGRFHQVDQQLSEIRSGVNAALGSTVTAINTYTGNIATLNQQIAIATAGNGNASPPNDLLDQRDALFEKLAQQVGIDTVAQSDGTVNVFLSNGQPLVVGLQTYTLTATADNNDPQNVAVGLKSGASTLPFRAVDVQGGALGGLLNYRDNTLSAAQNAIGRLALVTAQTFNDQHRLGQDLNGALGGDFFAVPAPQVQNALTNTGNAAITADVVDTASLTTSDYRLQYDGANFTLTRLADNQRQTFATLPQTVDGLRVDLSSGTPAAGDSFLLQPTRFAATNLSVTLTDTAKIAAGAPIRTAAAGNNQGSGTISAGSVDQSYPSTPLSSTATLTYNASSGNFGGFPSTYPVTVTSSGTSTTYAAGAPVPYTDGATYIFAGINVVIAGTLANNDVFTVSPNTSGVGDNRNAQRLASLATTNLIGGNTTLSGAYGQLVSLVGNQAHEAQLTSDAQAKLLANAQVANQSVSGVNLDEEAANLERYQQAYQASAKVLAIAGTLFDAILNIANG